VLPELFGEEVVGGGGADGGVGLERLEDADGQDGGADGVEPEEDDGALDGVDLAADAHVGAVDELEDAGGQGDVGGDEAGDFLEVGVLVAGGFEDFDGDGGERRQLFELLKNEFDAFLPNGVGHFRRVGSAHRYWRKSVSDIIGANGGPSPPYV
jgi:hypothetical protein